jgi:hypothetical protein
MAGIKPTFVVGARAKVKIDGKTLAFATSVNYTVDVAHVPVEALGSYEVISYEPVGYRVSGSLSIVRYTANANATAVNKTETEGNSVFKMGLATNASRAPAAFNPGNLILSETFDLEVYDRRDGNPANDGQKFITISDTRFERRQGGINSKGLLEEQYTFNGILMHDDAATVSKSGPVG